MKTGRTDRQAFTVLELFVVIVVLGILILLAGPIVMSLHGSRGRSSRINCVSNLKQVGVSFRLWANDNGGNYPMQVSTNQGGSKEFTSASETFRHFQVMSNELTVAKILVCPNDSERISVTNFTELSNQYISYFIGLNANETNAGMILSGDRNLTHNGTALRSGVYEVTTNAAWGWTPQIHKGLGNIGLADGSVQFSSVNLQEQIRTSTNFNRFSIP